LVNRFDYSNKLGINKHVIDYKILFMSRVEKEKGIFELITATKLLLSKGYNLTLNVAGEGKALRSIKNIVHNDSILKMHVNILGFVSGSAKESLLAASHIFCLPSYTEGFPNIVLEAMASGLIPVVTTVGGIEDFFKNRGKGSLIDNVTPEEICKAIIKAIELPLEKKSEIIASNFKNIKEHCSASAVSGRLINIYESVLC
jgi:glycosyltransferase involved in cell wall biosynthesis